MIVKVFTKDEGPETRESLELGASLESENYVVEYYDADEPATTQLLELYDVYSFPTFIVTGETGEQIEIWRGTLPLLSDIKLFLQ